MSSDNEEEGGHDNTERWLLTYCDMITLCFAFFVILYSMSITNLEKFKAVAISIRSGFGGGEIVPSDIRSLRKTMSIFGEDNTMPVLRPPPQNRMEGEVRIDQNLTICYSQEQMANLSLDKAFQSVLDLEPQKGNVYTVIVSDQLFFEPGKADLSPVTIERIKEFTAFIKTNVYPIAVEGYASRVADTNSEFKSSWELSAARAVNVIHCLCEQGDISPARFSMTAYGEWRPQVKTRQLTYTGSGQWQMLDAGGDAARDNDRVIIALRYMP